MSNAAERPVDVILDERECAELLGMAFDTLAELRRLGQGPPYARVGRDRRGKVLYLRSRIIRWIESRMVEGDKPGEE